jgi:hypothetical protein
MSGVEMLSAIVRKRGDVAREAGRGGVSAAEGHALLLQRMREVTGVGAGLGRCAIARCCCGESCLVLVHPVRNTQAIAFEPGTLATSPPLRRALPA